MIQWENTDDKWMSWFMTKETIDYCGQIQLVNQLKVHEENQDTLIHTYTYMSVYASFSFL